MMTRDPPPSPAEDDGPAGLVAFEDFRDGLPLGRFHVIVNPELAQRFVAQRVHTLQLTIALVGCGVAAALAGYVVAGALGVAAGIVFRRGMRRHAPRIVLHLASRQATTYYDAAEHGVMEVRRLP